MRRYLRQAPLKAHVPKTLRFARLTSLLPRLVLRAYRVVRRKHLYLAFWSTPRDVVGHWRVHPNLHGMPAVPLGKISQARVAVGAQQELSLKSLQFAQQRVEVFLRVAVVMPLIRAPT